MKFKKMSLKEMIEVLDIIEEVFGKQKMTYDKKENLLVFSKPVHFPEAEDVYLVGAGVVYNEEELEIELVLKMYDKSIDEYYYLDSLDL